MASSTMTPRPTKIFTCPCCSTRCEGKKRLREHQNGLDHKLRCPECPKIFVNHTTFKKHTKLHRTARESKKLPCAECSRKFVNSHDLEQHSETHRRARETNPLPCAGCPKTFVNSTALEQHISAKHRKSAPPERKARSRTPATGQPSNGTRFHDVTATLPSVTGRLNVITIEDKTPIISLGDRLPHGVPTILDPVLGIPAIRQPSSTTGPRRFNTWLSTVGGIDTTGIVSLRQNQHRCPLTILDTAEKATILQALSASLHLPDRLRAQRYTMPSPLLHNTKRAPRSSIRIGDFRDTPRSDFGPSEKRQAIVIDCEMVEVEGRRNGLASLTVIDFLTGEVLINNLVDPGSRVTDWRSDVSGVTPDAMELAVITKQALSGWQDARRALWIHADSETVFVGHSLNHDLDVLGILHHRVVDSAILTGQAVFSTCSPNRPLKRVWGLKKLAKAFLGCDIQTSSEGHSSLEDAVATREVVLCCLRNPGLLRRWADAARGECIAEKGRHKKKGGKRKEEQSVAS